MTTHLTEDDLVLHYYGELPAGEESRAAAHISACAGCHENFRRLQRVLAVVDENALAGPELPVHFERTVWARLEPSLGPERTNWISWFVRSPGRLAWVAMIVVLVGAAYTAGRFVPRTEPETAGMALATPEQLRERILLIDLGDHLDRTQMVLTDLVSADDAAPADMSVERARAEQLVAANRLYRQTAASSGDRSIAAVLDELERVLVDVAASPEDVSSADLDDVRRRIESWGLLFKVRVASRSVRERQRSFVQGSGNPRSST